MLLLSHILIAVAGLGLGTYSYFKPSKGALYTAYALGTGTLASGVWLLVGNASHLMSACVAGLMYFALFGALVVAARYRLLHNVAAQAS